MGAKSTAKAKQAEAEGEDIWSDGALNIPDAAQFLGVSPRSIYNSIYAGELERSKVRARTVVPRKQLRALLVSGAGRK